MFKISDAARRAALTVKTVRYYADIGLVKPAGRSAAGYRLYADSDLAKLGFIGRARRYSFSIDQCRDLLSLYEDDQRPSAEVKRITLEKIAEIDRKLGELQELRDELRHLAGSCPAWATLTIGHLRQSMLGQAPGFLCTDSPQPSSGNAHLERGQ